MALSVILIIFAAVAAPAWFARDKAGFESPPIPEPLLGLLLLALIPVSLLLILFSLRGFQQGWNIEAGRPPAPQGRGKPGRARRPPPPTAPPPPPGGGPR